MKYISFNICSVIIVVNSVMYIDRVGYELFSLLEDFKDFVRCIFVLGYFY